MTTSNSSWYELYIMQLTQLEKIDTNKETVNITVTIKTISEIII